MKRNEMKTQTHDKGNTMKDPTFGRGKGVAKVVSLKEFKELKDAEIQKKRKKYLIDKICKSAGRLGF